jgi:hypothetical protein
MMQLMFGQPSTGKDAKGFAKREGWFCTPKKPLDGQVSSENAFEHFEHTGNARGWTRARQEHT